MKTRKPACNSHRIGKLIHWALSTVHMDVGRRVWQAVSSEDWFAVVVVPDNRIL